MNSFNSVECMRHILMNEGIEDEEVLERTPERWVEALREFLSKGEEFEFTTFPSTADDMVIEQDIPFHSICAHHLLPFFGHAHVAYIPQGRVAGLSKLARVVTFTSLGLWSQEELCIEIRDQLERGLSWQTAHTGKTPTGLQKPLGVAVVMQATHTCMSVRGAKAIGATTITSAMCGVFRDNDNSARAEFLSLIK